jgi:hypothetical protein
MVILFYRSLLDCGNLLYQILVDYFVQIDIILFEVISFERKTDCY